MTFDVASPAALGLVLAAPLFVWSARHRAVAAGVCRAVAWSVLAVVLAEPHVVWDRPATGACLVAATDVSASVGDAAREAARRVLRSMLGALGPDDVVGAIAFAARPAILAAPAAADLRSLAQVVPDGAMAHHLDPDDTDIAAAVATATALCPAGKQPAVLLFTDGNETVGHVLAETALAGAPVPVFPVLPPFGAMPDVTLRRLLAPRSAPAGLPVPLEAVVEARTAISTAIALTIDGQSATPRPVDLEPGLSVVALPYRAASPGAHRLEARLLASGAGAPAAGVARVDLDVTRPIDVLWVSERDPPPVAVHALVGRGVDVAVVRPEALGRAAGRLGEVDVLVVDGVPHRRLPDAAVTSIGRWVADGGALVVTGGEALFGDPGFVGGPLERLLPVELVAQRPAPEEREPLAVELVIDRSNSMGTSGGDTTRIDYARRAALALLDQLAPTDLVGAIVFDEKAYELAPPRSVASQRVPLAAEIRRLRHGGGTDFLEALETARRRLLEVDGHVRHVILLTDGDTNRRTPDHYALIEDLMRADTSVTTLRIGADTTNLELLTTIARATGGEFHHVARLETLPQLLIHDMQQQRATAGGRRGARVRFATGGPMLAGIAEREIPRVARWARTRARPDAEVRLVVDTGATVDPLLATWGWELGRVAVLPVDFQSGAASWAVWRDFGKVLTQLVRWLAPRAGDVARHARPGEPDGVAREGRTLGTNRAVLEALARTTGGRVDPTPADVLRVRGGGLRATRPAGAWLLPLVLALVVADVALRRARS